MLNASIRLPPVVALAVSTDAEVLRTVQGALRENGDQVIGAMDLAEAMARAASEAPSIAFVDVSLGDTAGLALVHHLQAIRLDIRVYALAPVESLDVALQAVSMGAAGMLSLPLSGDAVLQAIGELRERQASRIVQARLELELRVARQRADAMHRLVRLLPRAPSAELGRAAGETIYELAAGRSLALYLDDSAGGGTSTLAASHGAETFPSTCTDSELAELRSRTRTRELLPISSGNRRFGTVLIDQLAPERRAAVSELVGFAGSLFAARGEREPLRSRPPSEPSHGRFEPFARFNVQLARAVEHARRHGRQLSVASIAPLATGRERPGALEHALERVVRDGDVLGRSDQDDELLLLLPDTGGLGSQLCRRRIGLGAVGLATTPYDAGTADALIATARRRRADSERSVVRALNLGTMSLRDLVTTLLACPLVDAGIGSPYPLVLLIPAALSLVTHACLEARRGGPVQVVVGGHRGVGFASAVREAASSSLPGAKVTVIETEVPEGAGNVRLDAVVVAGELGTWSCCGIIERDHFNAVHSSDSMLADLLAQLLLEEHEPLSGTLRP